MGKEGIMDNVTRSERSRKAVLEAALAIIARDGPGRLTLDAIARESGISKGGLVHQFRSKEAVLKALLERQTKHYEEFARNYLAQSGSALSEPELAAQIATWREAATEPRSFAFTILGAMAEDPGLLSGARETDARKIDGIKAEAADPELATLRWAAARGLALTTLLGICPLSARERARLFDRLLDSGRWSTPKKAGKKRLSHAK